MRFDPINSNPKLKAPKGDRNYAVSALEALIQEASEYKVISASPLPDGRHTLGSGHIQGVAMDDEYVILTTSAWKGYIFQSQYNAGIFTVRQLTPVADYVHPGGFQIIGSYIAVPVYNDDNAAILFYNYKKGMQYAGRFDTGKEKAYCVGITNTTDKAGNEFYVMAVVSDNKGRSVDFYRMPSGALLSDGKFEFKPIGTWKNGKDINKKQWQPDKKWNNYPNSMSLLADESGNVYLLGLKTNGLGGFGKDLADLYQIDLDKPANEMVTKLASFHAKLEEPAFRWGASASVTSDTRIRIVVSERNIRNGNTEIRLNILHASDNVPFGIIASGDYPQAV